MSIAEELLGIKGRKKVISPAQVVEFAGANPDTELHAEFDKLGLWDDTIAAEAARLAFGRKLIHRYKVRIVSTGGKQIGVRGFVSLSEDRKAGPSYRLRMEVKQDRERREMMVRDAQRELESFVRRYSDVLPQHTLSRLDDIARDLTIGSGAADSLAVAAAAEK